MFVCQIGPTMQAAVQAAVTVEIITLKVSVSLRPEVIVTVFDPGYI